MRASRLILLVDDDAYVRRVVRHNLQAAGYRVEEVESGEVALRAIHELRPDLVILDVVMTGMNGLEVCSRLRSDPGTADIPVLFLTSADDRPTRVAGLELGGQDYIIKPFDPRELLLRVRKAIAAKIQRDALRESARMLEVERERLEQEALADPLTGLANRRALTRTGERALAESAISGQPTSLWVLDVDHFKRVNDHWGHAVGDEVLKLVAGRIQSVLRERDLCARFGGEEFAVILPGVDRFQAAAAAERSRESVAALAFPVSDEFVRVTVSIGAATWPADGATLAELLTMADQRLYAAKRSGRNRVDAGLGGVARSLWTQQ